MAQNGFLVSKPYIPNNEKKSYYNMVLLLVSLDVVSDDEGCCTVASSLAVLVVATHRVIRFSARVRPAKRFTQYRSSVRSSTINVLLYSTVQ